MKFAFIDWTHISGTHLLPRRYMDQVPLEEAVELQYLCEIASGVYADEYVSPTAKGAVPYLRVNNVREFVPNITPCDLEYVVPRPEWGNHVVVAHGDVVIARTGTLGRAFVVPRYLHGSVMSQHVTRLRLKEFSSVCAQLLAAYLNSSQGKEQVMGMASGSTRLELTHNDMNRIRVPRRVMLSRWVDCAAEGVEQDFEVALGSALAAFRMCERLALPVETSEQFFAVPYDAAAFAVSLVPNYHQPSHVGLETLLLARFECVPLNQIALVKRGAGNLSAEYDIAGIPYMRTSSIINYGIEFFPEHYGSEEMYHAHKQNVGPGDILLTIEGKIGAVALLGPGDRCLIKNHIEFIRLHRSSPVPAEFVYALLSSYIGQIQIERRTVVQATIPGLGSESRTLLVPIGGRTARSQARFEEIVAGVVASVNQAQIARESLRKRLSSLADAAKCCGSRQASAAPSVSLDHFNEAGITASKRRSRAVEQRRPSNSR